jgi:hypothetical protein
MPTETILYDSQIPNQQKVSIRKRGRAVLLKVHQNFWCSLSFSRLSFEIICLGGIAYVLILNGVTQ